MADYDKGKDNAHGSGFSLRWMLWREWPYFVMLVLALFGVAYTNFARQAMTGYWIILAPVFGLICVAARRRAFDNSQGHLRLIGSQALHWTAVLFAMYLVFIADVSQMMSDFVSSLMVLTVLALGTFTAGIQMAAWRLCLVGTVLALGVPAIAWLEERTLLFLLVISLVLSAVVVFIVLEHRRGARGA